MRSDLVKFVVEHWRPYRRDLPTIVGLTLAYASCLVAGPIFLERIVDAILAARTTAEVMGGVGLFVAAGGGQALAYTLLIRTRLRLNLGFDYGVRTRAYDRLLAGPAPRLSTGDVVSRLTDDVGEKLAWFMGSGLLRTFEAMVVGGVALGMMARLDLRLALVACLPMPLVGLVWGFSASRLEEAYAASQAAVSRVSALLESSFTGIRVVKAHGAEPVKEALLARAIDDERRAQLRAARWQVAIDTLHGHVWPLALGGVLLVGGASVAAGEMTLGRLVAFETYTLMLVPPMIDLAQLLVRGRAGASSIGRIREVEGDAASSREWAWAEARRPDATSSVEQPSAPPPAALELAFDALGFDRGGDAPRLSGVELAVRPGTLTVLTGPVGSGKSTLLALAAGSLIPTEGAVRLGGADLRGWDAAARARAVALVPQEPYLFSTTVEENIRLGRPWVGADDVARAVAAAHLGADIAAWPRGLATDVGTRGLRLSGGQKQRVALARALAGRPAVLLLDDVTASLDTVTEDEVWKAIFAELPSLAVLASSHRTATLARADTVVRLP